MKLAVVLSVVLALCCWSCLAQDGPQHDRRVVCYMASWGIFLAGGGKFDVPDAADAVSKCTHLVYCFLSLDGQSFEMRSGNPNRDLPDNFGQAGIAKTMAYRKKFPHLKVLVSIGGWNDGSINYSNMVSIKSRRNAFVASVVKFLKRNKLDGLDIDWQFPGDRGGSPADKGNLVLLVKELRQAFDKHGYVLSLAVSCFPYRITLGFDPAGLTKHVHFINILAYEYHGFWEQKVGVGSPLFAGGDLSIEATVQRYLELGAPPDKINLGLSGYGMTFYLNEPVANGSDVIGMPAKGFGFKGPYNDVDGFIAYNEVCTLLKDKDWWTGWHEPSQTPFAVKGDRVMSYDNELSLEAKIKWAMENKLGGVLYYGLEKDDFRGDCSEDKKKYPMLSAIDNALVQYGGSIYNDLLAEFEKHDGDWFWNGMGQKN